MKAKKLLVLVALVLVCSLALFGCGGGGNDDAAAGDTIKVGVNYELTGDVAQYGQASVDGIVLAIEQINANGGVLGKQIELVQYDNKSEIPEVTSLATKLMTSDGVVAVIGPATSGAFKAEEPMATQYQIPILSGSATADDVTVTADGKVKDYVFRICFNDSYQGTAMAQFAKNTLGATKAAVIMDSSSDYSIGLDKNFTATFEADGGTVVARESYIAKDKDFNAILTKIKDAQFDVIYIPGYYNEAGLIIKQARDLGITCPILGPDGFDSPTLKDLAGAAALNDVYFTNHYSSLDQDPTVQTFIADFKAKYGKDPDAFNALGYDCGLVLADAIARAGEATPAKIQEALAATADFAAVTGTLSIDANHNTVKSITVIELANGDQASATKSN